MGGKIDAYLDCVSPYSYYALLYLQKNRKALASYGVEVEYEFAPVHIDGSCLLIILQIHASIPVRIHWAERISLENHKLTSTKSGAASTLEAVCSPTSERDWSVNSD